MKKIFLLFITCSIIFAQNKLDTLLDSIKNQPDSTQINTLNQFSYRYRNINPELAIKAANMSIKICEKIGDKVHHAQALSYLSVIYRDEGEYSKSLDLINQSLHLAKSVNDWVEVGYSYNNFGAIYRLMGNYPLALENTYKGLQIFEEHKFMPGYAFCCYTIGLVYLRQGNLKKANEYFELAYNIRIDLKDKDGAAKALSRIAEVHFEQGELKDALDNYNKVELAYSELNDLRSVISVWMGRASVYEKLKQYDKALIERKKALIQSRSFDDVDGVVRNSSMIGIVLGRTGNFSEGKRYLDSALTLSRKVNSSFLRLTSLKNSIEFYELQNDFKNAYKYSKLYNSYKDSLERKENSSVIAEVESAYLTNKKEKEKELLQKDLEYERKVIAYWIIALVLLIGITIVIILLYTSQRRANAIKDKLFAIIAHDLKNPFGILMNASEILTDKEWTITQEEKDQYLEMIASSSKKTYSLLENLLFWSRSQKQGIKLSPDNLELKDLIDDTINLLIDQANQKQIELQNNVSASSVVYADREVIKLIIRNLISNAIKFTQPMGKIIVTAYKEKSRYFVSIEDNGVGMPKEKADKIFELSNNKSSYGTAGEKGTGLGLLICKEFVERSGGKIWVLSEVEKGTKFLFTIPVNKSNAKTPD